MKKIYSCILACLLFLATHSTTFAADRLQALPETTRTPGQIGQDVDCVAGSGTGCQKGTVWDRYNAKAKEYDGSAQNSRRDVGACFASGIFSWDCIIEYTRYIIKFLSEIGIAIGSLMILYSGYKYATAVFTGKSPDMGMVKNAIIGVLIIIFSFAIIRILTSAFL